MAQRCQTHFKFMDKEEIGQNGFARKGRLSEVNSKLEIRNSKQIQMFEKQKTSKRIRFGFRISVSRF